MFRVKGSCHFLFFFPIQLLRYGDWSSFKKFRWFHFECGHMWCWQIPNKVRAESKIRLHYELPKRQVTFYHFHFKSIIFLMWKKLSFELAVRWQRWSVLNWRILKQITVTSFKSCWKWTKRLSLISHWSCSRVITALSPFWTLIISYQAPFHWPSLDTNILKTIISLCHKLSIII